MNDHERSKPIPNPEIEEKTPFSEEGRAPDGVTGLIKEIRDIIDKSKEGKRVHHCAYGIIVY